MVNQSPSNLRKYILQALRRDGSDFDFSGLIESGNIDRATADNVAESILAQLYLRALEDKVVTPGEEKKLNRIANRLEIPQDRQRSVFAATGTEELKRVVAEAGSDGEITPSEQSEIEQLRQTLGLGVPMTSTVDEQQLKREGRFECAGDAPQLLANLDSLRKIDEEAERQVRHWTLVIVAGVIGVFIGVAVFLGSQASTGGIVVAVLVGGSGLGAVIFGAIKRSGFSALDLENRRYELAEGVLKYLLHDMPTDAPANLQIDFLPHNHRGKFEGKGKVGHWNAKFFRDPWLALSGRLMDGTKFTIQMIEKQQDRYRTKRSASGKLKRKTKTKNASELIVSLKIKPKRYPHLTDGALSPSGIQLPQWVDVKSVNVEGDSLVLRSTTKAGWNVYSEQERERGNHAVDWIVLQLLALYSVLNPARAK